MSKASDTTNCWSGGKSGKPLSVHVAEVKQRAFVRSRVKHIPGNNYYSALDSEETTGGGVRVGEAKGWQAIAMETLPTPTELDIELFPPLEARRQLAVQATDRAVETATLLEEAVANLKAGQATETADQTADQAAHVDAEPSTSTATVQSGQAGAGSKAAGTGGTRKLPKTGVIAKHYQELKEEWCEKAKEKKATLDSGRRYWRTTEADLEQSLTGRAAHVWKDFKRRHPTEVERRRHEPHWMVNMMVRVLGDELQGEHHIQRLEATYRRCVPHEGQFCPPIGLSRA